MHDWRCCSRDSQAGKIPQDSRPDGACGRLRQAIMLLRHLQLCRRAKGVPVTVQQHVSTCPRPAPCRRCVMSHESLANAGACAASWHPQRCAAASGIHPQHDAHRTSRLSAWVLNRSFHQPTELGSQLAQRNGAPMQTTGVQCSLFQAHSPALGLGASGPQALGFQISCWPAQPAVQVSH